RPAHPRAPYSTVFRSYTPCQPEVAQGTLQVIYEFQSMVAELLGTEVANASMYDGATAMAEGALIAVSSSKKRDRIVVSSTVHPRSEEHTSELQSRENL